MKPVNLEYAKQLIDFAASAGNRSPALGRLQLEGAVAAYNMLARNRCAYLADEVGMGKTYVALGVMGLLRYVKPDARIMVIAPRENIQRKWIKELRNFIRFNWQIEGNRVKSIQGTAARAPTMVGSTAMLAEQALLNSQRDIFARMTSFSLAVNSAENRKRQRKQLLPHLPWITPRLLRARDPDEFRDAYGAVLNAAIPELDLLVVDEAHNLKHGFGRRVSTRNRILSFAFGGAPAPELDCPWYAHKVRHVLFLSATPFEYDYGDICRQFEIFGFRGHLIRDPSGGDPRQLSELLDTELDEVSKRELVGRLLIRRVFGLEISGKRYTKNMYRREWRQGGYAVHDEPVELSDTKQRLVVGLMQKKVSEVLGDKRFNNHFQIGMLSSFESFLETVTRRRRPSKNPEKEEEADEERTFDGEQDADVEERKGIDSHSLETVVRSYRKRFGRGLPHPKLDATADNLAGAFEAGEKALLFVRRIATVEELKEKLDLIFNEWLRWKMIGAVPTLQNEIDGLFEQYESERRRRRPSVGAASEEADLDEVRPELRAALEDDTGGTDTFFAWFFRGAGPSGVLSGAAFQKNRLASDSSAYATFFEDDHVSWILGRPADPLRVIGAHLNRGEREVRSGLRRRAFARFRARTKRREGYPRLYVFEGYQIAALQMLSEAGGDIGEKARIVLHERYGVSGADELDPPKGFPEPESGIGIVTFITELVKRRTLRGSLWPDRPGLDFRERLRKREQRRELLSALCRLGASFVDLYLLAIGQLGSLDLRSQPTEAHPEQILAKRFTELLEQQALQPGFHAYSELCHAAGAFETILAVNFPDVEGVPLDALAEIYGRALQHQVPVAGMSGGVNRRAVTQFRMPGFPIILVTTDVLQEGEDLHTFCRRVIHYGITWTPSAIEQRTGRVDRIGSLAQRCLEGLNQPPLDTELIQVHYPHLMETIEVVQVKRVLQRLDHFLRLIHRLRPKDGKADSRIDLSKEILHGLKDVKQLKEPLESAFPIQRQWLDGLEGPTVAGPDIPVLEGHLAALWRELSATFALEVCPTGSNRKCAGIVSIQDGQILRQRTPRTTDGLRRQAFDLELRSHAVSDATLMRCTSPVGPADLSDRRILDHLYDLQRDLGKAKVCARPEARRRQHLVTVEGDLLFHPETTQFNEVEQLVIRTVEAADTIEKELLERDEDTKIWFHDEEANLDE